ncbi:MAG: NADP-reducing hydrogenase subunit HndD [Clostridiales bacterium]|jgi:predicted molibdopterin-dependent oxidoreductase YjgC|nr:NADP-reducing hydrogenase subunit HndD [Clostridiales bacterium]MDK2932950.1 NADP-reducing hydrogenase subunit HndD [Clostridiales bacterium]
MKDKLLVEHAFTIIPGNFELAGLELILSNHERNCLTCIRNWKCELQELAESLGVDKIR